MKTDIPLYQIASDLKALYIKTGESSIEELFIQAAQTNEADFISWLSKNQEIQNSLGNPSVYSALMALIDIRNTMPSVNSGALVTYLHTKNYLGYVPTFLAFQVLLGSEVGHLVSPFANILTALAPFSGNESDDVNGVRSDLTIIDNEYRDSIDPYEDHLSAIKPKRTNRKERRVILFQYLMSNISNDVANNIETIGDEGLAQKIRNEGLLMRPYDLCEVVGVPMIPARLRIADNIYKEHLKPAASVDKDFALIYDNIKNSVMEWSSLITHKEISNFRDEKMRNMDWASMVAGDYSTDPFTQPLDIDYPPEVWADRAAMIFFSLILRELHTQITR